MKYLHSIILFSIFFLLFTPFVLNAQAGGGPSGPALPCPPFCFPPIPDSSTSSKIIGTRFCLEGETSFCRKVNSSLLDKTPLIPLYSQIITLLEQLIKSYEIKNTQ